MTIHAWLTSATQQLTKAGIQTARLDALVLLEDYTGINRAALLAHPETPLSTLQLATLQTALKRRLKHEPLAYIRGYSEFYGRRFDVSNVVLEPRPESETMIDLLKQLDLPTAAIADIGTGSGALAITAQLELPKSTVAAVDIDNQCLHIATHNAARHGVNIEFFSGHLLEPFLQKSCNFVPDVLICNLPYVPDDFQINQAAGHEPALALFGGPDGLDLYRQLFAQAVKLPQKPLLLAESLPSQHSDLANIAADWGYTQVVEDQFIQAFK